MAALRDEEVHALHALCLTAQASPDAAQRASAEQQLRAYCTLDHVPQLRFLLLSPTTPLHCHGLAACALLSLITQHWPALALDAKLDLRSSFLQAVQAQAAGNDAQRLDETSRLLCRVSRLGWFDHESFRRVAEELTESAALRGTPQLVGVALRALLALVGEFAGPAEGPQRPQQELRVREGFRAEVLLGIFATAVNTLRSMGEDPSKANTEVCEAALRLMHDCLGFRFAGLSDEDAGSDPPWQPPRPWHEELIKPQTLQLLWDLYETAAPPLSHWCLRCLARLATIAPASFAPGVEYPDFLARLLGPAKAAVTHARGLADAGNHAQLCRLWACCPPSRPLGSLLSMEGWPDQMLRFSIHSLQAWRVTLASHDYLLRWWGTAVRCGAQVQPQAADVCRAWVSSRLEMVRSHILDPGAMADPLESAEAVAEQAAGWAECGALHAGSLGPFLLSHIDRVLHELNGQWPKAKPDAATLRPLHREAAALLYFAGALLARDWPPPGGDGHRACCDLAARVCRLLRDLAAAVVPTPAGVSSPMSPEPISELQLLDGSTSATLAQAVLSALTPVLRRCLRPEAGEAVARLHAAADTADPPGLFAALATALLRLALAATGCEAVLRASLDAAGLLASEWRLGPLPLLPDAVVLAWSPQEVVRTDAGAACLSPLYAALARLLRAPASLAELLRPLEPHLARPTAAQAAELALALHGVAVACTDVEAYMELWRWLFPTRIATLRSTFEMSCVPTAAPMLELVSELVRHDPPGRLAFPATAPTGIVLFTEVVRWLTPGLRVGILGARNPDGALCHAPLVAVTMTALARCLRGSFCPLAAMAHYRDPALSEALGVAQQCVLAVTSDDRLRDTAVAGAYYELLEVLCGSHPLWLAAVDPNTFRTLLDSLLEVLHSGELRCHPAFAPALLALAHLPLHHFQASDPAADPARHLPDADTRLGELLSPLLHHLCLEPCPVADRLAPALISCLMTSPTAKAAQRLRGTPSTVEATAHVLGQALATLLQQVGDGAGGLAAFLGNLATARGEAGGLASSLLGSIEAIVQRSPTLSPALAPLRSPAVAPAGTPLTAAASGPPPLPFVL